MKHSVSLNKLRKNLTKVTALATVIGIATCLFPAQAQAQALAQVRMNLLRFSGRSDVATEVNVEFFLDPFVENTNRLGSDQGEFPGAILNFTDTGNLNFNLSPISYSSGTLTTSRLTTDPTTGNFPGFDYGYEPITDDTLIGTFNNAGLRYDITFGDEAERLTLFIPANDSNLFDSLSGLITSSESSRYSELQGVVNRPTGINERFFVTGLFRRPFTVSLVTVPEPTATVSLLGVGAMGAVSLLKRKRNVD